MSRELTFDDISLRIREHIIFEGLELQDMGIELEHIQNDTLLFEDSGLNLDSVDALEIIAGIQREFSITFPDIDKTFIEQHCATAGKLAQTVMELLDT